MPSPEFLVAIGSCVTALSTMLIGFLSTRSKVKLDDIATMQERLDVAEKKLQEEKDARVADSDKMQARHEARIELFEEEIEKLRDRLAQRDRTINHLDRVILALRTYVARARHRLVDNEIDVPADVEGMND